MPGEVAVLFQVTLAPADAQPVPPAWVRMELAM
jgi:hypothetical protein